MLIEKGANVNAKNKAGDTPLINASQRGRINHAKLLISNGAEVNAKDHDGLASLDYAIRSDWYRHNGERDDFIKWLISRGALFSESSLDWALHNCRDTTISFLVSNVADVKLLYEGGGTFLVDAAKSGNLQTVKAIISKGFVGTKAADGYGLLYAAGLSLSTKVNVSFEMIKLFVENGVDVNAKNDKGDTVLSTLTEICKKKLDVIWHFCLDDDVYMGNLHGAERDTDNLIGEAIRIIDWLIAKGADVNNRNRDGKTPLSLGRMNLEGERGGRIIEHLVAKGGIE